MGGATAARFSERSATFSMSIRALQAVALYPSAFDQRSPELAGSVQMTAMLLHFIAYCRGAAGIAELPAAGGLAVSAVA